MILHRCSLTFISAVALWRSDVPLLSDVQMCRCCLEVLSMKLFNKISGYKTQIFMWNIEKWKMKNSCLISKQNAAISLTKSQIRRLTLNQLSNVSGLINFSITLDKIATVTLNLFLVLCFSRKILLIIKLKRHPSH